MRSRVFRSLLVGVAVSVLVGLGYAGVVAGQGTSGSIQVVDVVVTKVGEEPSVVLYEALVTVRNVGDADFSGAQRVEYQVDGGDKELVYVVSGLGPGAEKQFKFRLGLVPGERTVGVLIGDHAHETSVTVSAADLSVNVNAHHVIRGGFVGFDIGVVNDGERTAKAVDLSGQWDRLEDGEVVETGEVEFGSIEDEIGSGDSVAASVRFEVEPGEYRFEIAVSTASTEADLTDNTARVERGVEYVEYDVVVKTIEVVKWHADGRGLVALGFEVSNVGVDDGGQVLVGIECADEKCSAADFVDAVAVGETGSLILEVWVPVGSAMVEVYAGANEDGFRWGDGNVEELTFEVAEAPELSWSLSAVSDVLDLQYWSDGSANAVFETTLENQSDAPVIGEIKVSVSCTRAGESVEDCGDEFAVEVESDEQTSVARHVLRLPSGETELHFAVGDDVLSADAVVPRRILGVSREVWECFSDTSNLRRRSERDEGVGCGGWRNDYVAKWRVGQPIRVWTTGESEYEAIFNEALDYLGPIMNLEFQQVESRSDANLHAYLGLPRTERAGGLRCNHAAGCTSFDIDSDGAISAARLVVWPPLSVFTDAGRNRMIRSIAAHELVHALAGMLHRHDDRTSLMSYDALDYVTLGPVDEELIRIASDPLVKPGMRFNEVEELVVFDDELVDRIEPADVTVEGILRLAHANLMDEGTARYVVSGGWTGCDFTFEDSQYSIGGLRPRGARWVHFKNDEVDLYLIRARSPVQLIEYWMEVNGRWRPVPSQVTQRLLSFRDSFTNPVTLLSSINLYRDGVAFEVVSETDGVMTLEVELGGADVRTSWSRNTTLDVRVAVDTSDYTIPSYEMTWGFEPEGEGVCDTYRVVANEGEYGEGFEIPEIVRRTSVAFRLDGDE